jgi:hypothetical protein
MDVRDAIASPNPAEALWLEHAPPSGYPEGVLPVPEPILGTSFFPGGFGLWNPSAKRPIPRFPVDGIMVLGHDFHSEAGYRASLARGFESPKQPTWRHLVGLLKQVGIAPEECFFTNVYMGLRAGVQTTGPFPGGRDAEFVSHCRRFLLRQIVAQQPRLILTLGVTAPYVLAPLSPELAPWAERRGLKHLDSAGPVQSAVRFPPISDLRCTVVALTHPCLRPASVRYRRYKDREGADAELLMLEEALG